MASRLLNRRGFHPRVTLAAAGGLVELLKRRIVGRRTYLREGRLGVLPSGLAALGAPGANPSRKDGGPPDAEVSAGAVCRGGATAGLPGGVSTAGSGTTSQSFSMTEVSTIPLTRPFTVIASPLEYSETVATFFAPSRQ